MKNIYYTLKNRIEWIYQWMRYGFSKRQLWSLDHTITDFILPRLKAFRHGDANSHVNGPSGCPMLAGYDPDGMGDQESDAMYQEWLGILDKMILAFEYHQIDMDDVNSGLDISQVFKNSNESDVNIVSSIPKDEAKWAAYKEEEDRRDKIIEEGLILFAKYYRGLWD